MLPRLIVCFSTVAAASVFAASSYNVTLFNESQLGGKTLKPGDYKLQLNGDSVALKHNKDVTEAPAKIETSDKKFNTTTVRFNERHEIQEIMVGGTNKKIILGGSGASQKESLR